MVAGGEDGVRGGERAVKKVPVAVASFLAIAGAAYVTIYSLPFLGIDWVPQFGPVPCPSIPILDIAIEKWKDPSFRRDILDELEVSARNTNGENLFREQHVDLYINAIARREAEQMLGKQLSREEFRSGMSRFGLVCGRERGAFSSSDASYSSVQIDCIRNLPRGCPSRSGHWPLLFPSSQLVATATFRLEDPWAIYTSYALSPASAL